MHILFMCYMRKNAQVFYGQCAKCVSNIVNAIRWLLVCLGKAPDDN